MCQETAMCFTCTTSWSLSTGGKLIDSCLHMRPCNQKGKELGYTPHSEVSVHCPFSVLCLAVLKSLLETAAFIKQSGSCVDLLFSSPLL